MALNAQTARILQGILIDVLDHHDESKPEIVHDLDQLGARAASVDPAGGTFAALCNDKAIAALIADFLPLLIAKLTAPKPVVLEPGPKPAVPSTPTKPTDLPPAPPDESGGKLEVWVEEGWHD